MVRGRKSDPSTASGRIKKVLLDGFKGTRSELATAAGTKLTNVSAMLYGCIRDSHIELNAEIVRLFESNVEKTDMGVRKANQPLSRQGKEQKLYYRVVRSGGKPNALLSMHLSHESLKKSRMDNGLTQAQLAKYLGISNVDVIRRWENGEASPSADMLLRFMVLTATMPKDLITKVSDKKHPAPK